MRNSDTIVLVDTTSNNPEMIIRGLPRDVYIHGTLVGDLALGWEGLGYKAVPLEEAPKAPVGHYWSEPPRLVLNENGVAELAYLEPPKKELNQQVGYIPSRDEVVRAALMLADAEEGERFVDLGSGDGIVLAIAAEEGLSTLGIEIDPERMEKSLSPKYEVRLQDLRTFDVREADIIYVYLNEPLTNYVGLMFEKARKGTRLVSQDFFISWRRPDKMAFVGSTALYVWRAK